MGKVIVMKKSKKLVFIAVAVLVLLGGVFAALGPLNGKNTSQESAGVHPSPSGGSSDCGDDRACFYQAYADGCVTKTVKASQATIEGDLIETTAKTVSGNDGCIIEVTMDSSKDRYGDGKVHTFTCKKLVQNPQIAPLLAQECTGTNMLTELSI